jgi:hypothetical protein
VDPRIAAGVVKRLSPVNVGALTKPLTAATWRDISSTYVVCGDDQAIPLTDQAWHTPPGQSMSPSPDRSRVMGSSACRCTEVPVR